MGQCLEAHDDASEVRARSVGCTPVFVSQKMRISAKAVRAWYTSRKHQPFILETVSNIKRWSRDGLEDEYSKAASERAGRPPFSIGSSGVTGNQDEMVTTPSRAGFFIKSSGAPGKEDEQVTTSDEAWEEMRRRFKVAHRIALDPDTPGSSIEPPSPPDPVRRAPAWESAAARRKARDME
ncbi:hypothetical protein T484DRAFT_1896995 [Baffinella frigidus]|nr:hypothetical protein T484DRAFT_1896995 [Cryptophyta sp. CCMP2293]|mmetsp:Transcript_33269/g.78854  ORF Transcript_33269/g.78854 Transcript_33269/m.78854 type:complete len:180 (+) Transcript_33269:54-593(+)